ncbi:MAG TPA: NAD-dependent DNA ligase LigA [Lacunisphaera sp.]|nr:NAD-dependent DNA ligase LigA [Lacunisphaera sp.]
MPSRRKLHRGSPPIAVRWLAFLGRLFATTLVLVLVSAGPMAAADAETAERIDALRAEIAHHDELYFKQAAPEISDVAYDQLKRELAALERAHPELAGADGGVAIGDDRSGRFPTFRHRQRMLSLAKSYTEAELRAFATRVSRQLGRKEVTYVIEPKFDGVAISVTFENGRLVRAVTRGNGDEGDAVTANVLAIRGLPRQLRPTSPEGTNNPIPGLIELRGEIYVGFAEFNRINREREAAGATLFANPRNLAAGTLQQADPAVVASRRLEIVFYGHGACEPAATCPASQSDLLRQLRAWGLPTVENPRRATDADGMCQAVRAVGQERGRYAFPTDGAVVKLDDAAAQRELGEARNAPLWAVAFKFAPDEVETRLRAIDWQVGRTGVITPVAELEPVQLGGSTVSRASLHNAREVVRRDIRVGDFVIVEKAGEIVPAITGINLTRRSPASARYVLPMTCPECRTALLPLADGAAALRCTNEDCPAQVRRRLEHFVSADGMDIPGLGPAAIDKLVQSGVVRSPADLFRLRRPDLLASGVASGERADRLLADIAHSRRAELWRVLNALGIPRVGETTARTLALRVGSLERLARWPGSEGGMGRAAPGSGRDGIDALDEYLRIPAHRALVQSLAQLGIGRAEPHQAGAVSRTVAGKVFVLTGTLPHLSRREATEKIEQAGGKVATGVLRQTDYVVFGDGSGAKLDAARKLGVAEIDEEALLRMLAGE